MSPKTTWIILLLGAALMAPLSSQDKPFAGGRVRIISSSHQDIAWMDSPEACMKYRDESCITPALEMMARDPGYSFVMENMLNLMEYVERHPGRKAEILRYTKEGRLEWGATLTQPYESLLSGEQLIRQTYFGRRWLKKNFPGCDALVYFNPDVPGRSLQMQQILSKAGIPYMVISRYHEGFYRWGSPDGSSVLAYSPGHYGNSSVFFRGKPEDGVKALAEKMAKLTGFYRSRGIAPEVPLLHSEDFSKPSDFGPLIELWNRTQDSKMGYSSARAFFEGLAAGAPKFDAVKGERPNLWLYIHGPTHHWAIAAQREAGRLLPAAETFATIDALLGGSFANYPGRALNEAWLSAVYPDHGWGGKEGQVTDRLFRKKYEFARDAGRSVVEAAAGRIAARIETHPGQGRAVAVFNALSWPRTDPVAVTLLRPTGELIIADAKGEKMPYQFLPPSSGQPDGTVRVEFIAKNVPAVGYKTFYVGEAGGGAAVRPEAPNPPAPLGPAFQEFENDFYKIILAPGGLKSIFDKTLGREILNTEKFLGFEIFTMQSVGNGAGEFGRVQQPTMEDFDKLSLHHPEWRLEPALTGPVKTVFGAEAVLPNCKIRQKLVVYNATKRIDCEVDIIGWDGNPYREFRIAVPVAAPEGKIAYEVPLGVVEVGTSEAAGTGGPAYGNLVYDEEMSDIRPREVQNFMNASDGRVGVTLTTDVAVNDYKDPTADPVSYPVLQGILLASRRSCHGQGNWYLQEGDHHYRFSLTSHLPGWRNGYKAGIQPNDRLIAVVLPDEPRGAATARADLPPEMSFVSISSPNVLLSTVKKCEDDDSVIVRLYDIEGKDADVDLKLFVPAARAELVNMIEEEEGRPLTIQNGAVRLRVGHHAIESIRIFPAKGR
ncbi:MAG: alpha-mannosidase [Candidatus Aminicenantes bacterium]|nr:alpha-mannosidase [Candidatus Aminicenantes bacterium]